MQLHPILVIVKNRFIPTKQMNHSVPMAYYIWYLWVSLSTTVPIKVRILPWTNNFDLKLQTHLGNTVTICFNLNHCQYNFTARSYRYSTNLILCPSYLWARPKDMAAISFSGSPVIKLFICDLIPLINSCILEFDTQLILNFSCKHKIDLLSME